MLAQAITQPPLEQSMEQFPFAGHEVLQPPPEQWTSQAPSHQVRHLPLEQLSVQGPGEAQVVSQWPPEQLPTHGS